mmetsp:Transcript_10765/g.37947  ORF Transcript_10765/g.37947 Transcript_10765/m.37947 type:complete len:296 (+) Transcript_10765:988-1875(+)
MGPRLPRRRLPRECEVHGGGRNRLPRRALGSGVFWSRASAKAHDAPRRRRHLFSGVSGRVGGGDGRRGAAAFGYLLGRCFLSTIGSLKGRPLRRRVAALLLARRRRHARDGGGGFAFLCHRVRLEDAAARLLLEGGFGCARLPRRFLCRRLVRVALRRRRGGPLCRVLGIGGRQGDKAPWSVRPPHAPAAHFMRGALRRQRDFNRPGVGAFVRLARAQLRASYQRAFWVSKRHPRFKTWNRHRRQGRPSPPLVPRPRGWSDVQPHGPRGQAHDALSLPLRRWGQATGRHGRQRSL